MSLLSKLFRKSTPEKTFVSGFSPLATKEAISSAVEQHEAVAGNNDPLWVERPPKMYPDRNQLQTSSCVASTMATIMGAMYEKDRGEYAHLSHGYMYKQRSNRADPYGNTGMGLQDIYNIAVNGSIPSVMTNDDMLQESTAPKYSSLGIDIAKVFSILNAVPVMVQVNMDTIASTLNATGKPIMAWFYFTVEEWSQLYPKVTDISLTQNSQRAFRHSVTITDGVLVNGKKYLYIQDSAKFGGLGGRYIDESFLKARCILLSYPLRLRYSKEPRSSVPMTAPVNAQSISGAEMDNVKILQDNLRILGYFPANVESTGYYGKLTTDAVRKWKSAHNIYRTPATDFDSYCVELINKEV